MSSLGLALQKCGYSLQLLKAGLSFRVFAIKYRESLFDQVFVVGRTRDERFSVAQTLLTNSRIG